MSEFRMYRQGDVLFVKRSVIPKKAKKLSDLIIAEGEVTGHLHQVKEKSARLYEDGNAKWLKANSPITIIHDEHKSIRLPRGNYEVIIQREYEPKWGVRNVID